MGFGSLGRLTLGRLGAGGGGDRDPTAITPANADAFLASLGLTQAGTGTTWGETGQAATPLYAVAAGKVPLAVETIGGKKYFGPIVNPAGTNLARHDRDATQSAWVKTGCTAELQTGSLSDAAAANGHTLITATADNATALQAITSTSGERVTKWWVSTDDEGVFVSHGAPTGSDLVTDVGFPYAHVPASGVQTQQITCSSETAGKRYRAVITATSVSGMVRPRNKGVIISGGNVSTGTTIFYFMASSGGGAFFDIRWEDGASASIDAVTIYEVAETELTPGANPVPVDLAAYTAANPQLGIRIANNGDSVRLYGVQHQVAARPLRPRIGPTAGSTVTTGARTLSKTLVESPSVVHLKLRFRTPTVNVSGQTVFSVDNNAATNLIDLKANGSGGFVLRKVIASSETAFSAFAVDADTLIQIEVEISASVFRYRLDGGSWVDGTAGIPGSLSRFRTGHDNANAGQLGQPILAIDELSTVAMLADIRGWNKRALL